MTKSEFNKQIDNAIERLTYIDFFDGSTGYRGCCHTLNLTDTHDKDLLVKQDFSKLFNRSTDDYFFGYRWKESLQRRQIALELFRNYVLDEKLHNRY